MYATWCALTDHGVPTKLSLAELDGLERLPDMPVEEAAQEAWVAVNGRGGRSKVMASRRAARAVKTVEGETVAGVVQLVTDVKTFEPTVSSRDL